LSATYLPSYIDEPNFKLSLLVLDIYGMVVETLKARLATETKIFKMRGTLRDVFTKFAHYKS
jgi:hypothetical protein